MKTIIALALLCFTLPVFADEPTVAEKKRLQSYEIVKKRNRDDGHLPTEVVGQAVLPDGSPAVGFKIDGWSRSGLHGNYGDDFFDAVTDENGRFTLSLWRPYLYWVRITDPNGVYVAPDRHFELKATSESHVVRFQLQKGIPVEGIVMDRETKKPVADLPVWLIHKPVFKTIREFGPEKYYDCEKDLQMPRQVRTDSEGRFRFVAPPAEYLVSLSDSFGIFRPVPKEILDVYARFVTVEEKPIDVKLDIPTPWRGRVLQKDGTPAAFYPVEVYAKFFGDVYTTDRDGYFVTFTTPEIERVVVDTPEQGQWFFKEYDKEILPRDTVFQLYVPLTATGRLVRKSTSKPLENFKFACRPRPGCTDIAETDKNGDFKLSNLFLGGKTNLCFLNEPGGFDSCLVYHTFKSFTPETPNKPVELGVIELEESGWLDPNSLQNLPGKRIEIKGVTLDGKSFDWKRYEGKVVLVDFWATWCGPCLQEIPRLKTLYEKYHGRGFEIVGISIDENLKALEDGLDRHEFPWTVLSDRKAKDTGKPAMTDRFGIAGVPRCILVDRDGKVISVEARGEKLDAELKKMFPDSLDEAATYEAIRLYVEHAFTESRKNMKTLEDQERFFETCPPVGIAAGRKIIALGGNDESLEYGYGILLMALSWTLKKHPENAEEIESLAKELRKIDKFPEIRNNTRFELFYHRNRLFDTGKFSKPEFDALKEEAKSLAVLKPTNHSNIGPMELILETAQKVSFTDGNPDILDETLEELVQFIISGPFEKKEMGEKALRGFCRRMVGSPFELWGKTVDGRDFDWAGYKNKVVLIDFTASWCGPCRAEMPNVVEMYDKYHRQGFEVVCIGYEDKIDDLKKMMKEDKVSFVMISEELSKDDPRGLPSDYYGIFGIPEIFLVAKDGRILATGLRGPKLRDMVEKQFEPEKTPTR